MGGSDRALVTGAAAGLGLAIARRLTAAGWHVVAVDRDRDGLDRLRGEAGGRVSTVVADLADVAALEDLGGDLAGRGPYQRIVMNAGISATGEFASIPVHRQQTIVAVNLTAPMVLTASLLRNRAVASGCCMIFVSSLSRYVGYPGAAAYAATKEGLAIFARSLRRPLARRRIKVLTVCPGPIDTDHAAQHAPPGAAAAARLSPDIAAGKLLAAARHPAIAGLLLGGNVIVPGWSSKTAALAGRIFPSLATRLMRRIIFEKLQ